jgi:hypothetical protein
MKAACLLLLLSLLMLTSSCEPSCRAARWGYSISNGVTYEVAPTSTTPGGIKYDATGQNVPPELIDRLTREVGDCLKMSIDPASFVVKIPAGWSKSCDGSQEMLPSGAPEIGCMAKGLGDPDPKCPCRWRALIQCPNTIVATPSLYLFKDALTRFVTGSVNPWADPKLVACASPSTPPLSSYPPLTSGT